MIEQRIATMAGVEEAGQPAGNVELRFQNTDTMAEMTVEDGAGRAVTVFLDRKALMELMVVAGAIANNC